MPAKHLGSRGHLVVEGTGAFALTRCVLVALAPHAPDHPFDRALHGYPAFLTYGRRPPGRRR